MEQQSQNNTTLMEEREEIMVSSNPDDDDDKNPILKKSHFLKPSKTSIDEQKNKLSSDCFSSAKPIKSMLENGLFKVNFNGWRNPQQNWEIWVDKMVSKHKSTWVKTGIYESILSTKYVIDKRRSEKLICGFASKWCLETKSFIFSWGEATISLEDVMILGGYSVLGDSVLCSLDTEEMKEIEKGLCEARLQVVRTKVKKACQRGWLKYFMEEERKYEHEAFLTLWLSRFVFPSSFDLIVKHVFAIAIHLAKGTRIALAPAVLACLYRDLGLLKQAIDDSISLQSCSELTLWSPFHLVLVWIWERFVTLRPGPDCLEPNSPRISRWHKKLTPEDVTMDLNSLGGCFLWRPYTLLVTNWVFPRFYRATETWVLVDSYLTMEIEAFARCITVSELVGIVFSEQYLPHRVARQFGFDQDIPGDVCRCNGSPQTAWESYDKKLLRGTKLYLPARVYEAQTTVRYSKWWTDWVLSPKEQQSSRKRKEYNAIVTSVPPGFPSKRAIVTSVDSSISVDQTVAETSRLKSLQESLNEKTRDDNMLVPPTIHPNCSTADQRNSVSKEAEKTLSELFHLSKKGKSEDGERTTNDHVLIQSSSSWEDNKSDEKLDVFISRGKQALTGEAATGGLDRVAESANENSFTSATTRNTEIETGYCNAFEIPGLDLESRINVLEKELAALKEMCRFNPGSTSKKGRPTRL